MDPWGQKRPRGQYCCWSFFPPPPPPAPCPAPHGVPGPVPCQARSYLEMLAERWTPMGAWNGEREGVGGMRGWMELEGSGMGGGMMKTLLSSARMQ